MITIAFRLDDPSALSDHSLEEALFDLFAQHRIPLTVAVIPFAPDQNGSCVSASAKNCPHIFDAHRRGQIEIALHGHSHIHRSPRASHRSEFFDVSPVDQERLISEAKNQLEVAFGHQISGFVPPWNSFDLNTALIAKRNGFTYLSAGMERPYRFPRGLSIIPRTCNLRSIDRALGDARKFSNLNPCIVVVMHPDDFREFRYPPAPGEDAGFTGLSELNRTLASISHPLSEIAKCSLRELHENFSKSVFWSSGEPSWFDLLPHRVQAKVPGTILFSKSRSRVLFHAFSRLM